MCKCHENRYKGKEGQKNAQGVAQTLSKAYDEDWVVSLSGNGQYFPIQRKDAIEKGFIICDTL